MLTIGIVRNDILAQWIGSSTQQLIKEKISQDANILHFDSEQAMMNALLEGKVSVCPRHLSELPTQLPEGVVITALSDRHISSNSLVIPKKNVDESQFLTLKPNAKVSVMNDISRLQFSEFRPDVLIEINDWSATLTVEKLQESKLDACILPSLQVQILDLSNSEFAIIPFSSKEFVPEAGQGIVAFLTAAEDIKTRRLLKVVHTPSVSAVSNVERRLKQLFNDTNIAAYCEKDRAHNYHLWAATISNEGLKKTRLSHSTHYKMAEQCFEKLQNERNEI